MKHKKLISIGVGIGVLLSLAGCYSQNSTTKDQKQTDSQLREYQNTQPIPKNDFSEYRQTVIDVEQAQVHGVATTTFFMQQGNPDPIKTCSSIGFAVASTAQLTNPEQVAYGGATDGNNGDYGVIGQQEPNGVYTGDTSGTYVVCTNPKGIKYISYWEGFVETEGGPAHWDYTKHQVVLDGAPTVTSNTRTK